MNVPDLSVSIEDKGESVWDEFEVQSPPESDSYSDGEGI